MKIIEKWYLLIFSIIAIISFLLIFFSTKMIKENSKYDSEWSTIRRDMWELIDVAHYNFYDFKLSQALIENNNVYYMKVLIKQTSSSEYVWAIITADEKSFINNSFSIYYEGTYGYLIFSTPFSPNAKNVKYIPTEVLFNRYIYNPMLPTLMIWLGGGLLTLSFAGLITIIIIKKKKSSETAPPIH